MSQDAERQFTPCIPKALPESLHVEAASVAVAENPTNAPAVAQGLFASAPLPPARLAALTQKVWAPDRRRLGVGFFGPQMKQELRDKILWHANVWSRSGVGVEFYEDNVAPVIRVAGDRGGGHWSYLGTDALMVPKNEPTINLDGVSLDSADWPESEWARVVPHEFGHALDFPHEHQLPEILDDLDPARVIALYKLWTGWSDEEIRQQVLVPPAGRYTMSAHADREGIMCYAFPASVTKSGREIPGGRTLTTTDIEFARRVYPRTDAPPPPTGTQSIFTMTFSRDVKKGYQVSFAVPRDVPKGSYAVVPVPASQKPAVRPKVAPPKK